MRGCEADRCEAAATVDGRWCERHVPHRLVEVPPEDTGPLTDETTLADVTPGHALEAPSDSDPVADAALQRRRDELVRWWKCAAQEMDEATDRLEHARAHRVEVLMDMRRTGMSLGDIAEVTGLTRQRIGQLLKG